MNKFLCIGRLTRDVEIIDRGNIQIGKFSIAISRSYKNEDGEYEADYLNCVLFKISEYFKNNLKKGTMVSIEGRIQTNIYQTNEGNNKYSTDIIVERVQILSKNEKKEGGTKQVLDHIKTEVQQQFEYSDEDLPW